MQLTTWKPIHETISNLAAQRAGWEASVEELFEDLERLCAQLARAAESEAKQGGLLQPEQQGNDDRERRVALERQLAAQQIQLQQAHEELDLLRQKLADSQDQLARAREELTEARDELAAACHSIAVAESVSLHATSSAEKSRGSESLDSDPDPQTATVPLARLQRDVVERC